MANLGSFGTDRPRVAQAEPDTFTWFDQPIRLVDEVNEVELIDLMDTAREFDANDMAALVVLKDGLRTVIDPADFDTFWALAKQHRQGIEALAEVMKDLMEAMTGRPTQQPSDSSDGRLITGESSPVVSTSPATRGRPDLELIRSDGAEAQAWLRERITG